MRKLIGYAKASAGAPDVGAQAQELRVAGCESVFIERQTRHGAERPELEAALDVVRERCAALVVTSLDRLAGSLKALVAIVETLEDHGATLRVLKPYSDTSKEVGEFKLPQPYIDTSKEVGAFLLPILRAVLQFETALHYDRQLEGIAKAKASGRHMGRPKTVDNDAIRTALAAGEKPAAIAARLRCARSTVYRVKDDAERA